MTTERVRRLTESHRNLHHTKYRVVKDLTILDDEALRKQPLVIRKAKALTLLLKEMPIFILNDELIVGSRTIFGSPTSGSVFRQNESQTRYRLPVKNKAELSRLFFPHYATEKEIKQAVRVGLYEGTVTSHIPPGHQRVLRLGYGGIRQEAIEKIETLKKTPEEHAEKVNFLHAVVIAMEGASYYARRYAREAEHLAAQIENPQRRRELQKISEICRWVSFNPPRSFQEALQLFWFTYVITLAENYSCIPSGRFDQYMYPFLKVDLEKGRITREAAQELLECLWIKLNEWTDITTDTCNNLVFSGQDSKGRDATNELTYMSLEASVNLRLPDPKMNMRFHKSSPPSLLRRCCEIVTLGIGGFPAFYNDETIIPSLLKMGIPLEDARDFSNDGCQEIIISGKSDFYPLFPKQINILECLDRVLHWPAEFRTFEEFMTKFKRELSETIRETVEEANRRDAALPKISPVPFLSATLEGCIEKAKDKTEGGTLYNFTGLLGGAFASTVNSLAAIKKIVYEEKLISIKVLRDSLKADFDGAERLRQLLINRAPKYGNDDEFVDSLAIELGDHFIQEGLKYRNPRGGSFIPGFFTFHYVPKGWELNATPDGRRAGDSVSWQITPSPGTDRKGPTAVINSALKVCSLGPPFGTALDLKFHPSALSGADGVDKLMAFIKLYMEEGGIQIQFNVVDAKTLRDAQKHPERHKDLIVRVWGFSAYFVTLTPAYQENIIARTEHGI